MSRTDVVIRIAFDIENPGNTIVRTNLKAEAVEEVLENWLLSQAGTGKDGREPDRTKSLYEIEIKLDLEDDTFFTKSNTGNNGLTCGLVLSVFSRLGALTILPLS